MDSLGNAVNNGNIVNSASSEYFNNMLHQPCERSESPPINEHTVKELILAENAKLRQEVSDALSKIDQLMAFIEQNKHKLTNPSKAKRRKRAAPSETQTLEVSNGYSVLSSPDDSEDSETDDVYNMQTETTIEVLSNTHQPTMQKQKKNNKQIFIKDHTIPVPQLPTKATPKQTSTINPTTVTNPTTTNNNTQTK